MPYDSAPDLFQVWGAPVNLGHPLAVWCRVHSDSVERDLPDYLRRIVRALDPGQEPLSGWQVGDMRKWFLTERVERLNAVFDDLARLRPDLDVPSVRLAPPDEHGVIRSR